MKKKEMNARKKIKECEKYKKGRKEVHKRKINKKL